jgi:NAD(P)-dependent dehydrogenase (short-subunit alcohol dehydrogenase family)
MAAGPRIQRSDRLAGRVAIVTGGAAGLGRAIAGSLAAAGAQVAVFDVDGDGADRAARELEAQHGTAAMAEPVDVSSRDQVERGVAAVVERLGSVDVLVNNAGVSHVGKPTHEVTDEEWHRSLDVMQTGVFYCMRAVAPIMLARRRGAIVNVASIRAEIPNRERIAYCAPKAAVVMMTRVAAAEWAADGIRVNAVSPGFQETPMWRRDVQRGVVDEERYLGMVPMGRLGDPHEVGQLVCFLCSDEAGYITGANVTIDGALTSALV